MSCINDIIDFAQKNNNTINTNDIFAFFEVNTEELTSDQYELIMSKLNKNSIKIIDEEEIDIVDEDIDLVPDLTYYSSGSNVNSVKQYLHEMKKYPILTIEEEKDLLKKYKAGSKKAFDLLIACNWRLVYKIAKTKALNSPNLLDFIQEGNLGLMQAIENFEPSKGYKLSTYATYWIRRSISKKESYYGEIIRQSRNCINNIKEIKQFQETYYKEFHVYPQKEVVRKNINSNPVVFDYAYYYAFKGIDSLNRNKATDSNFTLMDIIKDDGECVEEIVENKEIKLIVEKAFEFLASNPPTGISQKTIIKDIKMTKLRYGFITGEVISCEKIAQLYGVTRQSVDQSVRKTTKRLKPIILNIENNRGICLYKKKPITR